MHFYNEEEIKYLKKITSGRTNKEITKMFNEKFNLNQTEKAISAVRKRYEIKSGLNGQFKKGQEPWNKGIKGIYAKGCEKTWFKKGNTPVNHKPVGSERITVDGYTEIKVAEPNKWRLKQQLIWEKYNGTIPKGYSILFGDGNKRNFDIDNLILVSRQQLLIMNRNKLIQADADLTKTGLIIADIYQKIGQRKAK